MNTAEVEICRYIRDKDFIYNQNYSVSSSVRVKGKYLGQTQTRTYNSLFCERSTVASRFGRQGL